PLAEFVFAFPGVELEAADQQDHPGPASRDGSRNERARVAGEEIRLHARASRAVENPPPLRHLTRSFARGTAPRFDALTGFLYFSRFDSVHHGLHAKNA